MDIQNNEKVTRLYLLIKDKYQLLGTGERRIADYILGHEDEILELPIAELAAFADVSQPTAVRFCKKLGFNGIKEFKIFAGTVKGSGAKIEPCALEDEDDDIFKKVFKNSMSAIESSFKSTTIKTMSKVADLIYRAESVLVFGVGGSAIPAEYVYTELSRFGKKVFAYTDLFSLKQFHADFNKSDLALFVSRSGETDEIYRIENKAKENGAAVVAITTNVDSAIYRLADYAIVVREEQLMNGDKNSFTRIGEIALISCLYIMCAERKAQEDPDFKENYIGLTNYR